MKHNSILFFITISFVFFTSFIYSNLSPCNIKVAMRQNLSAYPYEEPEWPDNDTRFIDYLRFIVNLQNNLQENSKRRAVFLMTDRFVEKHPMSGSITFMDNVSWKDLSVFCGESNPLCYLADTVDRSTTIFGKIALYNMLAKPTVDQDVFINKQNIIKEFLKDEQLFSAIEQELKKFKSVENSLVTFWLNDTFKKATDRQYFKFSYDALTNSLNKNATLLTLRSNLAHQQRCVMAAAINVASVLLPIYGMSQLTTKFLPENLNRKAEKLVSSAGPIFGILQDCFDNHRYIIGMLAIASGLTSALSAQESTEWAIDNFKLDELIHNKMRKISIALRCLQNINDLIQKNTNLIKLLNHYHYIPELFSDNSSPDFKLFLKNIQSQHFKSKSTILSNSLHIGKSLVTFKAFGEIKEEVEDALMALAEIDAFIGITKLYKQHENSSNQYCFATCNNALNPTIKLDEFWNPCVQSKNIICNSIDLGSTENPLNMVITGPNAGGKSTLLKGIAISILLTQSFGITPAKQANITLFDAIMTYLNITDDLTGGNSLFKNQVLRLQKILKSIQSMDKEQKALILLDEMFNGTSPKEAQSCAFSVSYLLGKYPQVSSIIATHYKILTQLPSILQCYKNYHVSVVIHPDGSLTYPFTLEKGISDQHVALQILSNEGFNDEIIQKAQEFLNLNV